MNLVITRILTGSCWVLFSGIVNADLQHNIGYTHLQFIYGDQIASGKQVPVAQVEISVARDHDNDPTTFPINTWIPDTNAKTFHGKQFTNRSGENILASSAHATSVAKLFFGLDESIAPGISDIENYWQSHWLGLGYLASRSNTPQMLPKPSHNRLANHSWAGAGNSETLWRIDWLIDRDEYIQCVGVNNSGHPYALLSSAYNTISAGRSDGLHAYGSAASGSFYSENRIRPNLVLPVQSTSAATAVLCSASALLIELGQTAKLSTDPLRQQKKNRLGDTIFNGSRSEVIKAALMAGADRYANNKNSENLADYRANSNNGLDARYGAGQLNIYNSYSIIANGEQNSQEDAPDFTGQLNKSGFDYDPAFGGYYTSNAVAHYSLPVVSYTHYLTAALVWNAMIIANETHGFTGYKKLFDLNLALLDLTTGITAHTNSTTENSENIWTTLHPHHRYQMIVSTANPTAVFDWDYAIAWHMSPDQDDDAITDFQDNCPTIYNPAQQDTNQNGIGDLCEPSPCAMDINQDGNINWLDFTIIWFTLGVQGCQQHTCTSDLNHDDQVDLMDVLLFVAQINNPSCSTLRSTD